MVCSRARSNALQWRTSTARISDLVTSTDIFAWNMLFRKKQETPLNSEQIDALFMKYAFLFTKETINNILIRKVQQAII